MMLELIDFVKDVHDMSINFCMCYVRVLVFEIPYKSTYQNTLHTANLNSKQIVLTASFIIIYYHAVELIISYSTSGLK